MFLELIHGLFITLTEFRLSTTFIPIIIVIHIYNWYLSIVPSIVLYTRRDMSYVHGIFSFAPLSTLLYLLGTLLAVTGSVHLVPRLLVN
jgi:hypothetical protein